MAQNLSPGASFRIETPQSDLDDLAQRLARTRLPARQIADDWNYGTPLGYARRLLDRWMNGFDWRHWERRINRFNQRMLNVEGQAIHVVVEQGSGDKPLPLILTHGWPGSFLEFVDLIEPLAHPERFGGKIEDAFTVVLPSLPGYGYSGAPAAPLAPRDIARLWSKMAVEQFGFTAYAAQAGDWGSSVTSNLALYFPECLVGIHLNTTGMIPTLTSASPPMSAAEMEWAGRAQAVMMPESAYQQVQATKPQSLAFAQTDSPMGLACWIIEKFQGWTIPGESGDPPFDMDWLIANVMLYWLNGPGPASWLYTALRDLASLNAPPGSHIDVPSAFTLFPRDLVVPAPREWVARVFNVQRYMVAPSGGHFPALENPDLMLAEIRGFFSDYR
jgi:pimeloyl-ACP methyl ester carboxylesterase